MACHACWQRTRHDLRSKCTTYSVSRLGCNRQMSIVGAAYRFSSVYRGTQAALKSAVKMILASLCGLDVIQYGLRPHAWPEPVHLILISLLGWPKLFGDALRMVWPSRCVEPCARETTSASAGSRSCSPLAANLGQPPAPFEGSLIQHRTTCSSRFDQAANAPAWKPDGTEDKVHQISSLQRRRL
uniref:Uncharacterized protein n=1 Tax=Ralstonia solanacearum TaxID=305 RepID=A0A0S4TR14_RALSL|nr:protein of unknown function [Ralstonia solanacearum]